MLQEASGTRQWGPISINMLQIGLDPVQIDDLSSIFGLGAHPGAREPVFHSGTTPERVRTLWGTLTVHSIA